jgi:antitoxin (DNA-binding transcriptional repressor) of toxin-antitoxin stability system
MGRTVSIAEVRETLDELVQAAAQQDERIVLLRDGKPVAAVVAIRHLHVLDHLTPVPGSLAEIAGQWAGFDEIEPHIDAAVASRQVSSDRPFSLE